MVGDTEYDMQLARNAGTAALGVVYGVHSAERLLATGALDTLGDLRDLLPWLAGITPVSRSH
jgi:phosphoglycolate phosphatase